MSKLNVARLVEDVRSLTDEDNREALKVDEDILPSLNRAKTYALNILGRGDESPYLTSITLSGEDITSGTITIPSDSFMGRVNKIEVQLPGGQYETLEKLHYRDITPYESSLPATTPYFYTQVGNTLRIVPTPSGTYPLRLWYIRDEALVMPQGTLEYLPAEGESHILVDEVGSDLSSSLSGYSSYLNVVNRTTGEIRGTFQIESIDSARRITLREIPTRETVRGRTVLPASSFTSCGASLDDYICSSEGTCVPLLLSDTAFLIQYAALELSGKLDGSIEALIPMFTRLENQVERQGRDQRIRVKRVPRLRTDVLLRRRRLLR